MAKSVKQELRELRRRVNQLSGQSNDEAIRELVGEHTNPQMNPTRTAFADAASANQADTVAKLASLDHPNRGRAF